MVMGYNRLIDSFITFLIDPHVDKTSPGYPISIFWVKDGVVISEIENHKYFWLHYNIWDKISDQFGFEENETQLVIKTWLEQHYNLGGLTPRPEHEVEDQGWNNIIIWED